MPPELVEANGRLIAVQAQRNQLADQVVVLHGQLTLLTAKNVELEARLKKAEAAKPKGGKS